jgi:hypothetical protein
MSPIVPPKLCLMDEQLSEVVASSQPAWSRGG